MSHTVTITRTTTTNAGSGLFLNTGYLCTTPGILKVAQLLLGAACVGVVGYYFDHYYRNSYYVNSEPELFFLLVAVALLVGTFCIVLSCVVSLSTASILPKTNFEVIYHSVAFILYLAAGLCLLIEVNHYKNNRYRNFYDAYLAASIMGLILAGLYLFSAVLAHRAYKL